MASLPKRARFDATALTPSDSATTPMGAAKESIQASVASLQPEIAKILSRLGTEFLVCLHRQFVKARQVKRFVDDEAFIPRSARVNFTLKGSKLVEQDQEYISLVESTATIVESFQNDLRKQVLAATKLEVKALAKQSVETFASVARMAVKACFTCEQETRTVDTDKFMNTLLSIYDEKLLVHLKTSADSFHVIYKRVHSLPELPPPFITSLPESTTASIEGSDGSRTNITTTTLPPAWLLQQLPRVWRILDQILITPWNIYQDVTKRNESSLALRQLNEEFFNSKVTDDTALLIDNEQPVEPQILNDLIANKVTAATKKMSTEIAALKKSLTQQQRTKNSSRDKPSAGKKKMGKTKGDQAAERAKGSNVDNKGKKRQQAPSSKSSNTKNTNSKSKRDKSNRRTARN